MKRLTSLGAAAVAAAVLISPGSVIAQSTDLGGVHIKKAISDRMSPEELQAYKARMAAFAARKRESLDLKAKANAAARAMQPLLVGDTCAAATYEVSALPFGPVADTTVGATDNYDLPPDVTDPTCAAVVTCTGTGPAGSLPRGAVYTGTGTGPDRGWKIRTNANCTLTITMDPTGAQDLALLTYLANCTSSLADCACVSDTGVGGAVETISLNAVAGTDYFIVVDGYSTGGTPPGPSGPYTLSVGGSGCALVAAAPAPTATVSGDATICAGSPTNLSVALTGTPPWSITWNDGPTESGILTTPHTRSVSPVASFTYSLTAVSDLNGAGTFSGSAAITATQPPTTATVGGPQTICNLSTTVGLGGNTPTSGTGVWSLVSGGTGTFSLDTDPNATFTHTGGAGPFVLRWTISNSPCADSTADVAITISASTTTQTFSNPAVITIPTGGPGTPYPSDIVVSGVVNPITNVAVTLSGVNHTWPNDIDILLVGPTGASFIIMSDAGSSTDIVNGTLTLDDSAATLLPNAGGILDGSYRPTDYGTGDTFVAPAPAGPYGDPATAGAATFASVFSGLDANGTWSLYVVDDTSGDLGSIDSGWSLAVTSTSPACCSLTVPAAITVPNDAGTCGAVVTYPPPTGSGPCGVVTSLPPSGSTFPLGTTTVNVTCSASPVTGSFNVTVTDGELPVVTPPADLTINQSVCCGTFGGADAATNPPLAAFLAGGSATDNCTATPTALPPQVGGVDVIGTTCFEAGINSVDFRFEDGSTNIGSATAFVVVQMFGDLNLDFGIDAGDMVVLRAFINGVILPGTPPFNAPQPLADMSHDGSEDAGDMLVLRAFINGAILCMAP